MTDIVKKELERHIKELNKCVEEIPVLQATTEEIVKLNFKAIRMLVDYLEELCLEGEPAMERWLTPPRLKQLQERNKQQHKEV